MISGFLISSIIFINLESNSFSLLDFYSRRIKRIFPALIIVLFSSLILGFFVFLYNFAASNGIGIPIRSKLNR